MRRMMAVLVVVCLLVGSLPGRLRAQEAPRYRLRTPTTDDYLLAAPAVGAGSEPRPAYGEAERPYFSAIGDLYQELKQDFDTTVFIRLSPADLDAAFTALNTTPWQFIRFSLDEDLDAKFYAILVLYLQDNLTDLGSIEESFTIDLQGIRYTIIVQAADLDGDGESEFILDLYGGSGEAYFTADPDPTQRGGYIIAPVPLTTISYDSYFLDPDSGQHTTLLFEDINGDGLIEWVDNYTWGSWGWPHQGLTVLGWRDGRLVSLGGTGSSGTQRPSVTYDPSGNLRAEFPRQDIWRCTEYYIHDFVWDASTGGYSLWRTGTMTEDSFGCRLRGAEQLIWDGNFAYAGGLYSQALRDLPALDDEAIHERVQYAHVRQAITLALRENWTRVDESLAVFVDDPPVSGLIETLVAALNDADRQPLAFCTAAYDVFAEYRRQEMEYGDLPTHIYLGFDDRGLDFHLVPAPEPELAGCNPNQVIAFLLEDVTFSTAAPLEDQLSAAGVPSAALLDLDTDGNGVSEWLVMPDAPANPLLFLPAGDAYLMKQVALIAPDPDMPVAAITLPDGRRVAGQVAAASWLANPGFTYSGCDFDAAFKGYLGLWGLNYGAWETIFTAPICEQRPIDAFFQDDAHTVTVWGRDRMPVSYVWDEAAGTYTLPGGPLPTPSPVPLPTIASFNPDEPAYCQVFYETIGDYECRPVSAPMALGMYDVALDEIDRLMVEYASDLEYTQALHYQRAKIFTAQYRPDDALDEYVAIVEAGPDTAWGMLAALHPEPIE